MSCVHFLFQHFWHLCLWYLCVLETFYVLSNQRHYYHLLSFDSHWTLKMTSTQVVKNGSRQQSFSRLHLPDNHIQHCHSWAQTIYSTIVCFQATAAGGLGSIIRVLADRKTVWTKCGFQFPIYSLTPINNSTASFWYKWYFQWWFSSYFFMVPQVKFPNIDMTRSLNVGYRR